MEIINTEIVNVTTPAAASEQIAACKNLLEKAFERLTELSGTMTMLIDPMNECLPESGYSMRLLKSVVDDVRGTVDEAFSCCAKARKQLRGECSQYT